MDEWSAEVRARHDARMQTDAAYRAQQAEMDALYEKAFGR